MRPASPVEDEEPISGADAFDCSHSVQVRNVSVLFFFLLRKQRRQRSATSPTRCEEETRIRSGRLGLRGIGTWSCLGLGQERQFKIDNFSDTFLEKDVLTTNYHFKTEFLFFLFYFLLFFFIVFIMSYNLLPRSWLPTQLHTDLHRHPNPHINNTVSQETKVLSYYNQCTAVGEAGGLRS